MTKLAFRTELAEAAGPPLGGTPSWQNIIAVNPVILSTKTSAPICVIRDLKLPKVKAEYFLIFAFSPKSLREIRAIREICV